MTNIFKKSNHGVHRVSISNFYSSSVSSVVNIIIILLATVLILTLSSCIGLSADIQMRKDGSGKINLEYRFSQMAETIGKLDGNERWHIIPTGRADMERTASRIPGMKLVSFSTREEKPPSGSQYCSKNIINKATLEFQNSESLLYFFDPAGKRASLSRENGSNKLQIIINEKIPQEINAELLDLARQVSAGYKLKITFSAPGKSWLTFTDGAGKEISAPAGAEVVSISKKVSLVMDTEKLLEMKDGLGVVFVW